jgi:hypothetical protein
MSLSTFAKIKWNFLSLAKKSEIDTMTAAALFACRIIYLINSFFTCSVPSTSLDMVIDYYNFDYEFAEPPRVTSLQNTVPLPTFSNFGEDVYFVADQRGYQSVVYHLAHQFLKADKSGTITDSRLMLNKVITN